MRKRSVIQSEEVRTALSTVQDPELAIDVLNLGLVYDIGITGSTVKIRMTFTTPGCPLVDTMIRNVRSAVSVVRGVRHVDVEVTFDPPWTPDRISPIARERIGLSR